MTNKYLGQFTEIQQHWMLELIDFIGEADILPELQVASLEPLVLAVLDKEDNFVVTGKIRSLLNDIRADYISEQERIGKVYYYDTENIRNRNY